MHPWNRQRLIRVSTARLVGIPHPTGVPPSSRKPAPSMRGVPRGPLLLRTSRFAILASVGLLVTTACFLRGSNATLYDVERFLTREALVDPPPQKEDPSYESWPVRPRAFRPWPTDTPLPCFAPDGIMTKDKIDVPHNASVAEGIFFTKTFKTASSTSAGVNLRIAHKLARRQERDFRYCKARFDHGHPWRHHASTLFGNRTVGESFLWAILRHPTDRAISSFFYFQVSRHKVAPTEATFRRFLPGDKQNYYITALSTQRFQLLLDDGIVFANQIIKDYDFIGTSERLDESFVALSVLLRIPLSDVLYLSAKVQGSYDARCNYIQPRVLTTGMKEYLQGEEWTEIVREDLALYNAVDQSLDLTIAHIGRTAFAQKLAQYRQVMDVAKDRCANYTVFACPADGKKVPRFDTGCLWKDAGCGTECLDEIATHAGINTY